MTELDIRALVSYGGSPEPAVELPARSMVDPALLKGAPEALTPEEQAELLSLLNPLRLYLGGRWITVTLTLARLRQDFSLYCGELQDRLDEEWRSTGAYQRARDQAFAAQQEAAGERRYERQREARREHLANNRLRELLDYGLTPHDAQRQVAAEFPEQ